LKTIHSQPRFYWCWCGAPFSFTSELPVSTGGKTLKA
jgi:hypothetical protein